MNTSRFRVRSFGRRAFTLIELLVVIAIIAILAGLLLPVFSKVMDNAHKVQTKATAVQIVTAVKSYQTEYGQYPVPAAAAAATPTDTTFNMTTGNASLFTVLRAQNTDYASTTGATAGLNSRRNIYFEGSDAKSLTLPKNGFVPSTAASAKGNQGITVKPGDLLDAWGNPYCIRMDTSFSDAVANPYTTDDAVTTTDSPTETDQTKLLHFGVVAWSYGSDGKIGANGTATSLGDDVISWQ